MLGNNNHKSYKEFCWVLNQEPVVNKSLLYELFVRYHHHHCHQHHQSSSSSTSLSSFASSSFIPLASSSALALSDQQTDRQKKQPTNEETQKQTDRQKRKHHLFLNGINPQTNTHTQTDRPRNRETNLETNTSTKKRTERNTQHLLRHKSAHHNTDRKEWPMYARQEPSLDPQAVIWVFSRGSKLTLHRFIYLFWLMRAGCKPGVVTLKLLTNTMSSYFWNLLYWKDWECTTDKQT